MKRLIRCNSDSCDDYIEISEIVSIVLVDDVDNYSPWQEYIQSSSSKGKFGYTGVTRGELLALSEKERNKISDIDALGKLDIDELTPMQQRLVTQANSDKFNVKIKEVSQILSKLKERKKLSVWDAEKNDSFFSQIEALGGSVSDRDVRNIIQRLQVRDYCYSTYSHLRRNWNSILIVFNYKGEYTFEGYGDAGEVPVTVSNLDIYIKIDVDSLSKKGYSVMSFHNPEFKLPHPYKDYPADAE